MEMIDSIAVSANHKILDPVMSYDPVTKKPINFPTLIYPDTEANNTKFSDYSYLYVLNEKTADT
jgi:hypothetical protein